MTPTELRAMILALGLSNSEMARRIGVNPRTMRRLLSGEQPITAKTIAAIHRLTGAGDQPPSDWPRDEWIVGEGPPPERREYVVHTRAPRFIARIVEVDVLTDEPEPDEDPVSVSGPQYLVEGSMICEIAWIDPAPTDPTALRLLIDRAADQLGWVG